MNIETIHSIQRTLGLKLGEAAFVCRLVEEQGSERGAALLSNPGALEELSKYAPLPEHARSPQNRRLS